MSYKGSSHGDLNFLKFLNYFDFLCTICVTETQLSKGRDSQNQRPWVYALIEEKETTWLSLLHPIISTQRQISDIYTFEERRRSPKSDPVSSFINFMLSTSGSASLEPSLTVFGDFVRLFWLWLMDADRGV